MALTTLSPDTSARVLTIGAPIETGTGLINGGLITLTAANDIANDAIALAINSTLNTTAGSGGLLTVGGGVELNSSPTVGAGNITLNGGGKDLVLGTININTSTDFNVVRYIIVNGALTSSNGVNLGLFADNHGTDIGGVLVSSAGSINSGGSLTLQGSSLSGLSGYGVIDSSSGIQIQSGSTGIQASGPIVLAGYTGVGNGNINISGAVTENGANSINFTPVGAGVVKLGENVTSQGGAISFNAPVNLIANVAVDTTNAGGTATGANISFSGVISSAGNALTLNGGTGGVISGSSFAGGGNLTIANSGGASFSGAVTAGTVALTNTTGTIAFNGNLIATALTTANQGYNVILAGAAVKAWREAYDAKQAPAQHKGGKFQAVNSSSEDDEHAMVGWHCWMPSTSYRRGCRHRRSPSCFGC